MEVISHALFVVAVLASFWAITGLIRPPCVLWWALPEKQTRGRAFAYATWLSFVLVVASYAADPVSPWWTWGIALLMFVIIFMAHGSFCVTQQGVATLLKEQERIKKANFVTTVFSMTSDKEYELRPFLSICSCPDWKKMRSDADGPFAVCKHLANYYVCHEEKIPTHLLPYRCMFLSFSIAEKGMPKQGAVSGYGVIDDCAYIFTSHADNRIWVNVYTSYTGIQQFGVNIETDMWARGEEPPFAPAILERIKKDRD